MTSSMKISDLLSIDRVLPSTNGTKTKDDLLRTMTAGIVATDPGISADRLLGALKDREKLGTTALEGGIALPHARLPGLSNAVAVLARSANGVDWGAPDANLSHLILLLVTPAEQPGAHLQLLASAAQLLRDPSCRTRLMGAADSAEILGIIRDCGEGTARD